MENKEISNEKLFRINTFLCDNKSCGRFIFRKEIGKESIGEPESYVEFIIRNHDGEDYSTSRATRLDEKVVSLQAIKTLLEEFKKEILCDRSYSTKEDEEFLVPKVTLLLSFLNELNG